VLGAPLLLASATAAFPQVDLIVVRATQGAAVFQDFARASLFYKGLYFLVLILSQWMLPYQIRRSPSSVVRFKWVTLVAISIIGSAAIALVAPTVSSQIMRWPDAPPGIMIFLSCCNLSLLSWVLLLMQEACAHDRFRQAMAMLGALGAAYAIVWTSSPRLAIYFAMTIAASSATIAIYLTQAKSAVMPEVVAAGGLR
jgi:hypothetical protein